MNFVVIKQQIYRNIVKLYTRNVCGVCLELEQIDIICFCRSLQHRIFSSSAILALISLHLEKS